MREAPTPPQPVPLCPQCGSSRVVRNGTTHSGTPGFRCRGCGRQFVADPKKGPISDATKGLICGLLGERLGPRGIARSVGVSRAWLQRFVDDLCRNGTPEDPGPPEKKRAGP